MKNNRSYIVYTILVILCMFLGFSPIHGTYANEGNVHCKGDMQQGITSENVLDVCSMQCNRQDTEKAALDTGIDTDESDVKAIRSEMHQAYEMFRLQKEIIYSAYQGDQFEGLWEYKKKKTGNSSTAPNQIKRPTLAEKREQGKVVDALAQSIRIDYPMSLPDFARFQRAIEQGQPNFPFGWRKRLAEYKEDPVKYVTNYLITSWNAKVDGLIQAAAKDQFHLYGEIDPQIEISAEREIKNYKEHLSTAGLVLESMRKLTLCYFEKKGIRHVYLSRGIGLSKPVTDEGCYTHQLSPLSSFTLSPDTAKEFAYTIEEQRYGHILYKRFPVGRILSFGGTGLGTFRQHELVVLGPLYRPDCFYIRPMSSYAVKSTRIGRFFRAFIPCVRRFR